MEEIKDIVHKVIDHMAARKPQEQNKIRRIWDRFLKGQGLEHTKILEFKDGNLVVNVDSAVWLFQLNMKKANILAVLREDVPEVKNIFFKVGKVN